MDKCQHLANDTSDQSIVRTLQVQTQAQSQATAQPQAQPQTTASNTSAILFVLGRIVRPSLLSMRAIWLA